MQPSSPISARLLSCALFAVLLVFAPCARISGHVTAQDTEEAATPADDAAVDPGIGDIGQDTESSADPEPGQGVDESVDPPAEATEDDTGGAESSPPDGEATAEPATEEPAQPNSELSFEPTGVPSCLPVSGDAEEQVPADGYLDYTCVSTLTLTGAWLDPAEIALEWSISATANNGWSVQLLDPTQDAWTDAGSASAWLDLPGAYAGGGSLVETFQDAATLNFGLRVSRPPCSTDQGIVDLQVTGTAALPDDSDAVVSSTSAQPMLTTIAPPLAALDSPLPSVSIVGVAIDPVAFSLTDTTTRGVLTIEVESQARQCQPMAIAVALSGMSGGAVSGPVILTDAGLLESSSIPEAVAVSDGVGASLADSVVISAVPAGAEAGTYQQTISFELTIPGAVSAGSYQLDASAAVLPAG